MVILDSHKEPEPEPEPNDSLKTFQLVRNDSLLVLGIVLILYGAAPPVDPGVFTFGGAVLGLNPALRAQQA